MTAPIRTAAIYARVSTEKQNPLSPDDQVRKCREYAQARGLCVLDAHIYRDEGLSGAGADRPGLARLLDAALSPARPFDAILVDDTSRLSRSTQDALSIFARLNFAGVQLVAVSQGIDSAEDQAEVLVTVHGMVDSLYVRELAKKTHRGLESKMLRGLHAGGRCFGYSNERVDAEKPDAGVRLVVNEPEAAIVRRIFELAAGGASLKGITRRLNAESVPAPRPRKGRSASGWCPTAIREMLRNERYAGRVVWNRHRFVKVPGTNRRVSRPRPQSEWRIEQAPEQRIVSEELWNAVQARLRSLAETFGDGRRPGLLARNASSGYLLSGLLYCAECGSRLRILYGRGEKGRGRYGCPRNYVRGTCGNNLRERQDRLESSLLAGIERTVLQPAAVEYTLQKVASEVDRRLRESVADLGRLRARQAEIERELRELLRALADGYSPAITAAIAERERELASITGQLLSPGPDGLQASLEGLREFIVSRLGNVRELLLSSDVERARAELARHVRRLDLRPATAGGVRYYVASGQWDFIGQGPQTERVPGLLGRGTRMVAGAGFEPATSGL